MRHQREEKRGAASASHEAKIIRLHTPTAPIDQEFEQQIQSLRSMIGKLHPAARQQYFDAFLDHLLSIDIVYPPANAVPPVSRKRVAHLSEEERKLIKELSATVQQLHRDAGDLD
ncbi:MAG: hypothetical protein RL021_498 [Bacteroidota bacterium]|jgi:hypothetical protein